MFKTRFGLSDFTNAKFYNHFRNSGNTPVETYVSTEFFCSCRCTFELTEDDDLIWEATFDDQKKQQAFLNAVWWY